MTAPKRFANLPRSARLYLLGFWALTACGLAWVLLREPLAATAWAGAATFAVVIGAGHLVHTPTPEHSYVLSAPFVLTASILLPPHQALAAIALGLLPGEVQTRAPWYTKVFNYFLYMAGGILAAEILRVASPSRTLLHPGAIPAGLLASAVFTITNLVAVALAVKFTYGRSLQSLLTPTATIANLAIDGAGLAMAALWQVDPLLLILGVIPLFGGAYALWMPHLEQELRLDVKTGVYNARFAVDTLHRLIQEHKDRGVPLTVIMADLDNLREINNRYGHLMGDRALQVFANVLKGEVGPDDYVARFGGEEFMAILPGRDAAEAVKVAEQARKRLRMTRIGHEQATEEATVTVSLGVAELCAADRSANELLHRADGALYEAKHYGRDQVAIAPMPRVLPRPPLGVRQVVEV